MPHLRYVLQLLLLLPAPPLSSCRSADEWRGRAIYQLLTDRFSVGGGNPREKCEDLKSYCGGNFRGIIDKLDHIQDLGFSAIWISPIVKNVEWRRGYHGYWAQDLTQVEPHFGTEGDLKALIAECHRRDIWVMLDVVPNHMGYEREFKNYDQFVPFNRPEHYHSYCRLKIEVEVCRLCGLPDLNQTVPFVRQTLLQWIRETTAKFGFDGYRVDTAKHVEKGFWKEYTEAAGVFMMGEVGAELSRTKYIAGYQDVLEGLLNFPTFDSLSAVFHDDRPMTLLSSSLRIQRALFRDVGLLGAFVDSHDAPRFLHRTADRRRLHSALAVTLLGQGIPVLYAGTELGFDGGADPRNRESLWPRVDDRGAVEADETFKFIRRTMQVRRVLLDRGFLPRSRMADKYADERTYAFARGKGCQLVVAISNERLSKGGYRVSVPGIVSPDGTVYREAHNSSDVVMVSGNRLEVRFEDSLAPKIYLREGEEKGEREEEEEASVVAEDQGTRKYHRTKRRPIRKVEGEGTGDSFGGAKYLHKDPYLPMHGYIFSLLKNYLEANSTFTCEIATR